MIFGRLNPENIRHKILQIVRLTCQMYPLYLGKSKKVIFNDFQRYYSYTLLTIYLISQENNQQSTCPLHLKIAPQ